jgi:hypothetical protein
MPIAQSDSQTRWTSPHQVVLELSQFLVSEVRWWLNELANFDQSRA